MVNSRRTGILSLLNIKPSSQSADYVKAKKPFHLHTLITEQRHPQTYNLSSTIKEDIDDGLRQILAVDQDISRKFHHMAEDTSLLEKASLAVSKAIKKGRKIFIYGCGSTGRLAKQMESALWRPWWRRAKKSPVWMKLKKAITEDIEELLIGEMTGGDRALISALEGLEDLQLVGKLQLKDRGVERGDVVFCITEGGETSSVIGAMMAACEHYGKLDKDTIEDAKNHLYFLYNNPDDVLRPFQRSRSIIENPAITKINITTGPQAITGSTRMQAATSETYIMGIILEAGIQQTLKELISEEEMALLGFPKNESFKERLLCFDGIRKRLLDSLKDLAEFTLIESKIYGMGKRATYFARKALITVFIDCAERSPTFHLYPLDTVGEKKRKCWLQVWTRARDYKEAWQNFLGREFRGLEKSFYEHLLLSQIKDPYLKEAALRSLSQAGNDQKSLYDFSLSKTNIKMRGPQQNDLGVLVFLDDEIDELTDTESLWRQFIALFKEKKADLALVIVGDKSPQEARNIVRALALDEDKDAIIHVTLDQGEDPLSLKKQTALKILLNAHSTAVMARMGRVVGNTMTDVNPSNLKLIGRATFIIMNHVNDALSQEEWVQENGKSEPLTYAQANAVLFEAMDFVDKHGGQTSEVELSIIRILEALRNKSFTSWQEALSLAQSVGLENYLERHNPALRRKL
jgi:N-acetylmuramic acid 6-phosphate (MurNAc-6-P) etherase/succinate dehydrogenase flavin-adding protein (antitoxin of CptAB toxin-antitoxin module)